jgi:O-antigen/teichoic acid export membrane protein
MSKHTQSASLRIQFIFLLLSRGFGSGLQAILVVVFARLAGTEQMGLVAIATGVMSMVLSVAEFGMSPLLSKSRALGKENVVNAIVRVNFLSSAGFGLLGFGGLAWYATENDLPLVVALLAISVAFEKNTDVLLNISIADARKWMPAISISLRRSINLISFLIMLALGIGPLHAYIYSLLAGALAGQIHVNLYRKNNMDTTTRVGFRSLIVEALPYSISNIAGQTKTLDTVIVGAMGSLGTAGLYSAAMRLTNPLSLVAGSLTSVVMPFAARNDHTYAMRLARRLIYLAAGSLLLVLPLVYLSEPIVNMLLGEEYQKAAGALMGGLLALPFLSLASPLGSILQSRGHQKFVAGNGVVFALVTLGCIACGTVIGGATGASFGLAVSFALKCVSLWIRLVSIRSDSSSGANNAPSGLSV